MANIVVLSGRLTRDVELKYLDNNNQVARFTLAVDKGLSKDKKQEMENQGKQTADFINCQAWGKIAENINQYTGKGLRVLIQGRIQTGSYEKDGQTVYTTDVVVSNIEYIDWKDSNSNNNDYHHQEEQERPYSNSRVPF